MAQLKIYTRKSLEKYITVRNGETKLGEKVSLLTNLKELEKSPAQFVIFGIPEDVGVRANFGKAGASSTWESCLQALLNVQDNFYNPAENLLVLGEIDCRAEMEKAGQLEETDPNFTVKLGELVEKIDEKVSVTVKSILLAGKTPIIIGGGHNNAFGNIKGASEAFNIPINVLNIDAHTDLRTTEHRHSGNGFSYALEGGFLKNYAVFGLHQNYTPQYIFDDMKVSKELEFTLFEDLTGAEKTRSFKRSLNFVNATNFGLEIDCDAIASFPSSAQSPTGFTLNEVREMVQITAKDRNCSYLHVCEAVATDIFPTGKALSYLITDFIKAKPSG